MRLALGVGTVALVLAACGFGGSSSGADTAAPLAQSDLRLVKVADGFGRLTHVSAPRSERGRLYVVEKAGRILILENGRLRARPFLDIVDTVGDEANEQGLLSVAFHPRYASNRKLYVNYTDRNGNTKVVEFRASASRVDPSTARQLLFVRQPYSNHNGGQLAFGPDGKLYVGMGDGGGQGDPENRAQDLKSKLGKLLRLDVDRAGARWETVAYGLRNPWRFSFDRLTGDLWLADVGQYEWEEIDYLKRGTTDLVNFGWDVYEGTHGYDDKQPNSAGRLVGPVFEYSHSQGCSVTGGFVYRGTEVPAMTGRYFFGDYCSGTIWSMALRNGKATNVRREPISLKELSSFGEDSAGELYAVKDGDGAVYKLVG